MNNTANPLIGAGVRETVENAAEALSAVLVLIADKHSDLCRLMMPVLHAIEHANETMNHPETSTTTLESPPIDPGNLIAEYNRCAAQVRAECEA